MGMRKIERIDGKAVSLNNWQAALYPVWDYRRDPIYIFDLDGTLADISHRIHHIVKPRGQVADWDSFFKACVHDKVIPAMRDLANDLENHTNVLIWIVSGRSSVVARETCEWLAKHNVKHDWLFMRAEGDHRPDYVLKEEWLNCLPKNVRGNIVCVFEDRKSVVDMWRRNGIMCCQVNDGDF